MTRVEAVYRHGVFEPLAPVDCREEQHVELRIEPLKSRTYVQWLNGVQALQGAVLRRSGVLPGSTGDIAADRAR